MRMMLVAVASCMMIGSVSGMDVDGHEEALIPSQCVSKFTQGYAFGAGACSPFSMWVLSLPTGCDALKAWKEPPSLQDLGYMAGGLGTTLSITGVSLKALLDRVKQHRFRDGDMAVVAGYVSGFSSVLFGTLVIFERRNRERIICRDDNGFTYAVISPWP